MKYNVFNNSVGSKYSMDNPVFSAEEQRRIIAGLFEQLMVFDTVTISTNRMNYMLTLLIGHLGINTVELLLERGYLKILLWSPVIVTSRGRQRPDGTMDESVIYNQPPIVAGSLIDADLDPEKNIQLALANYNFNRDRRRIFNKIARDHYIVPDGMKYSADAGKFVIDAYCSNNLALAGLPYLKGPNLLELTERDILLDLGYKTLETALVTEYNMKSYGDQQIKDIYGQNLNHIAAAYQVIENTSSLLTIEGIPNLQDLYLQEKLNFDSVFKLRHMRSAKYFRKWVNQVTENENAKEISVEYLNEVKGTHKFFESTEGKLLKNIGVFGAGMGLGMFLGGPAGAAIGAVGGKAAEFGLSLLDTFVLDNLMKGKNPSMFIDNIKQAIKE